MVLGILLDFRQAELDRQDELDAVEPTVEAAATDFLARFYKTGGW